MFGLAATLFTDRADAGRRLADRLAEEPLVDPVVIAIPRGGVELGAEIARRLDRPLDVVVARKLGAATQPELAIGAIAEGGVERLVDPTPPTLGVGVAAWTGDEGHLGQERERQRDELARRVAMFRAAVPQVPLEGRDAILVDDGVATGATLHASVESLRRRGPRSIVAALPVASPEFLAEARRRRGEPGWPDRTVCLSAPDDFVAVGQVYGRFDQVPDERAVALLVASRSRGATRTPSAMPPGG